MNKAIKVNVLCFTFLMFTLHLAAQQKNVIPVAVPFLLNNPDARASGMGEIGAATSTDSYSNYWNNAKTAFTEKEGAVSISYQPWLPSVTNGLNFFDLAGYKRLNYNSTIAYEAKYLNEQESLYRDSTGVEFGLKNPFDVSIGVSYALRLGEGYSVGAGLKYIRSSVATQQLFETNKLSDANALSLDLGFYYEKYLQDVKMSWGVAISNIGNKISYPTTASSFQPTNLRIGTAFNFLTGDNGSVTIGMDANKLLVPTPPIRNDDNKIVKGKDNNRPVLSSLITSFYDAPGGFTEEINEVSLGLGVEYEYMHQFFLRAGGVYENPEKGERRYLTAGTGFNFKHMAVDGSYLFPLGEENPYKNTFHITLTFFIEQK